MYFELSELKCVFLTRQWFFVLLSLFVPALTVISCDSREAVHDLSFRARLACLKQALLFYAEKSKGDKRRTKMKRFLFEAILV